MFEPGAVCGGRGVYFLGPVHTTWISYIFFFIYLCLFPPFFLLHFSLVWPPCNVGYTICLRILIVCNMLLIDLGVGQVLV